ncbi:MAG: hypothetical protein RML15_06270 [Bacteroidota bacterium]|nr:hypothetical protein [Bacteroidota bacterium]
MHVHACFAEGEREDSLAPMLHTIALTTLHRFDRLPPHRQSLAAIAGNIAGALDRLRQYDPRLEGITASWQFGIRDDGTPYDPHVIRQAVQIVTSMRPLEPRAFAVGICSYIMRIELARRGLPLTFPLLAYRVLQPPPWASFLEGGGLHSALLWSITALLGTFSPPGPTAVRFTVADCDRRSEALLRMLAVTGVGTPPITLADSLVACAKSPLKFDRIVALAETAADGYFDACYHLLHSGGKALIAIPTAQVERWWHEEIRNAIAADRVEALLEWTPGENVQQGWTIVVLRTTAAVHVRRRVLYGALRGELSPERIEELCDAIARGTSDAGWLQWQSTGALPTPQSSTGTFLLAQPCLQDLLDRWSERGIDAGPLVVGNNGSLRFDDRITTASLLRAALRSLHSLRSHEMRYYFTLYQWWQRIQPLLRSHGRVVWQTVEQSLVEHLSSVPSITTAQARALAIRWWSSVEPDLASAEEYSALSVVESIIVGIERKLRTAGVKLWKVLDDREEYLLRTCTPQLIERVHAELRRQSSQRQEELRELDNRIATLQQQLAAYRSRMAQLHLQAKAHDVPHDSPELVDSTLPLQNELSQLLKAMVVVQSELKMLQQNREAAEVPNQEDWFSPVVARCTAQLLPALHAVRRTMDEHGAWVLLLQLWEEQLHAIADIHWESLVAILCDEFEQVWQSLTTSASQSSASSRYAYAQ